MRYKLNEINTTIRAMIYYREYTESQGKERPSLIDSHHFVKDFMKMKTGDQSVLWNPAWNWDFYNVCNGDVREVRYAAIKQAIRQFNADYGTKWATFYSSELAD